VISFEYDTHDISGACNPQTMRTELWFPHPFIAELRIDGDWRRREQLVIDNIIWLRLSEPMKLLSSLAVSTLVNPDDIPDDEYFPVGIGTDDGMAVITGDLELSARTIQAFNASARCSADKAKNDKELSSAELIQKHAVMYSLRRASDFIRTIYELPPRAEQL
jgi:hypothetical protein